MADRAGWRPTPVGGRATPSWKPTLVRCGGRPALPPPGTTGRAESTRPTLVLVEGPTPVGGGARGPCLWRPTCVQPQRQVPLVERTYPADARACRDRRPCVVEDRSRARWRRTPRCVVESDARAWWKSTPCVLGADAHGQWRPTRLGVGGRRPWVIGATLWRAPGSAVWSEREAGAWLPVQDAILTRPGSAG